MSVDLRWLDFTFTRCIPRCHTPTMLFVPACADQAITLVSVKQTGLVQTVAEDRGNKYNRCSVVQHTAVSSLTTPWRLIRLWQNCDTRQVWKKRGVRKDIKIEKSQREGQVPASPVKHFSWILSSRLMACFWGFTTHRSDSWWGLFILTLKTVTIHSTLLVTWGHHYVACVSLNMCLCCYNTVKGTAEFPLPTCQSFFC